MNLLLLNSFTVIGACASVYFVIRIGATVVDIYQRWRDDDWSV